MELHTPEYNALPEAAKKKVDDSWFARQHSNAEPEKKPAAKKWAPVKTGKARKSRKSRKGRKARKTARK